MNRFLLILLSLGLLAAAAPPDEEARSVALRWLARVDAGDKGPIYNGLTESVKSQKSRSQVNNQLRDARARLGEGKAHRAGELVRGDTWVMVPVQSSFEDGVQATENVWVSEDTDGAARVSGYELFYMGTSVIKLGATPK